ncbi:MAG: GntR family transcriptional regulator [Spirochaetales bacterium]|nr:GntR family transcriptional regulator [Spirochaetales bacterium]
MFDIGKFNTLKIKQFVKGGCYLDGETRDIYLPKIETPRNCRVGDVLEVFIYNDAKESLKATVKRPLAIVGEFAVLKVKDVKNFGAFLEWGIAKDLFLPQKYIQVPLEIGMKVVVYVMLDFEEKGIIGSCYINRYLKKEVDELQENQGVDLLFVKETQLGFEVIIDNTYPGLVYKNEVFEDIEIGDKKKGYIKKLREDNRIDVSLQRQGFIPASTDAKEIILKTLKENNGFLPFNDNTSPEKIKSYFHISKKLFKKIIGGLYSKKIITIEDDGIRLL